MTKSNNGLNLISTTWTMTWYFTSFLLYTIFFLLIGPICPSSRRGGTSWWLFKCFSNFLPIGQTQVFVIDHKLLSVCLLFKRLFCLKNFWSGKSSAKKLFYVFIARTKPLCPNLYTTNRSVFLTFLSWTLLHMLRLFPLLHYLYSQTVLQEIRSEP